MSLPLTRRLAAAFAAVAAAALSAPPAVAQTSATFAAMATGTAIHAELAEQGDLQEPTSTRLVDGEVAFSSAVMDTAGLATQRTNEYGALLMPAQPGKNSYGRGYGMDVAFQQEGQTDNPEIRQAGLVEAAAPPASDPDPVSIGPVDGEPLAYASTLRGDAYANWLVEPFPLLGSDFAYGLGYAEDAELLDMDQTADDGEGLEQPVLATNAPPNGRSVVWSTSRTFLGPQVNAANEVIGTTGSCGVVAETRQTLAPVTLLGGQLTIEFLGEWVLRAHAGGVPGSAFVHYGPGDVSPQTPVLRILTTDEEGNVTEELLVTTQQLLGDEGLVIPALPLVELAIGEDPRAIGGDHESQPTIAADGTAASAAVDVVRLRLLAQDGTGELAEVRVGHMEVSAAVQQGGVPCGLPVDKSVDKALVHPGDAFTYTITVTNPYDCVLRDVRVVDTVDADPGVTWTVTGGEPPADSSSDTELVWNDVGPIPPGESKVLRVAIRVDDDSREGFFHDEAVATARCFDQPVAGEDDAFSGVGVPLEGRDRLDLPEVRVPAAAQPPALPRTGASHLVAVAGVGLLTAAATLRRRR